MRLSATRRQQDLLRFIHGYQLAHGGVGPSQAECAKALGLASKSSVHRMLGELQERGLIQRTPNRERAIEVLVPPAIPMLGRIPLYSVPVHCLPEDPRCTDVSPVRARKTLASIKRGAKHFRTAIDRVSAARERMQTP